jgi:NAD dependent epimerase/dehydratase
MTEDLSKKKIIVTGAGGFIGSHLTESLINQGSTVRAFVRYNSRADIGLLNQLDPHVLKEIEVISGDIRDHHAVNQAIKGMDLVFHLAALISIPYSYHHPREVVETNVNGTLNVLLACLENNIQRMIHTSTSEVYGSAIHVPINESHPLQGQSPYSASKIGADKLVESFHLTYNLPSVTVRPFNTYGPRQSARAVIPTIITQALENGSINLGSLETKRDFTYVSDTVNGFLQAARSENSVGQTYNLGTGSEVTIGELAEIIIRLIGRPIQINLDSQRLRPEKSEVMRLISDNQSARKFLDWQPEMSLEDGLLKTIDWISMHLARFRVGTYEY